MRIGVISLMALENDQAHQNLETEVEIYAKIGNFDKLSEASSREEHHQLEASFKTGTKNRVRKTTNKSGTKYVFTMKVKEQALNDVNAVREYSTTVDEAFFEAFKLVANRELFKTRYVFSSKEVSLSIKSSSNSEDVVIPNIEYEVDIYTKEDGSICEWCKIDVEIDNIINYISKEYPHIENAKVLVKVSHLPFEPLTPILKGQETTEQETKLEEIWKDFARILR